MDTGIVTSLLEQGKASLQKDFLLVSNVTVIYMCPLLCIANY